jgi:predicted RNA-binding protein (virulence factor B family)
MYDYETDRLFGSMKIRKMLSPCKDLSLEGQEVSVFIAEEGKLGRNVIVNNQYEGLIFRNHQSRILAPGEVLTAYVAKVREDGKLDITLEIINDSRYDAAEQKILTLLKEHDGFLYLHDKSEPDEIKALLGMSKKTFKQAIGKLYKHQRISLEPTGIKLTQKGA